MKREDDGSCEDGSDPEVAAPSVSRVSSSTNGNGSSANVTPSSLILPGTTVSSVISSPLRRQLELEAAEAARAKVALGNALVTLGQELANSQAVPSVPALGLVGTNGSESVSARGLSITAILDTLGARHTLASELSRHHRSSSKKSSRGSSEGSNSTSPLSLNMVSGGKPGPKPRAADSPGSGSTTSTTGVGNRDRVFRCLICDRSFGYKHVLQNHERTHTGEKPFECTECHKRFTRDHHLKTHMRLHTGEKPYQCDHCDRQFVQVANLRRHLRVHTGERPYSCEMCDSKFSDSNQLKAHNLIHRGEKPFDCSKCQGKFRRRHHLMHHKCPKDEANVGRPRRGRRPRAYDSPLDHLPTSVIGGGALSPHHFLGGQRSPVSPTSLQDLIQPSNISSTSHHIRHGSTPSASATASGHHIYPFQIPNIPHLPSLLTTSGGIVSPREHYQRTLNAALGQASSSSSSNLHHHHLPPSAHSVSVPSTTAIETKTSRRKPKPPTRILTQHQRELFLKDRNTMQTQPLNMSVTTSSARKGNNGGHLRSSLRRYKSSATYGPGGRLSGGDEDGQEVLDLSRSRSDFDSEPEDGHDEMMDDEDDDTINEEDRLEEEEDQDDEDRGSYPEDEDEDNPQDLSNNNVSNAGTSSESGVGKVTGPVLNSPGNGIAYGILVKNESGKRNGKYE